jgi:hypothetical protein
MMDNPRTLIEFEKRFSDEESCLDYLFQIRWPEGFVCPDCQGKNAWKTKRGLWSCASCGRQTSVTTGTLFHKTRKHLTVWFRLIWEMATETDGISAASVKRRFGFGSYQAAWAVRQKIMKAMMHHDPKRLSGIVEVEKFYWGGKKPEKRGRGASGNAIIAIAIESNGKSVGRIFAKKIESTSQKDLWNFITEAVEPNSLIVSGCLSSYCGIEIDAPCSNLQGIPDREACCLFRRRSLTPPQAAGNALALSVQGYNHQVPEPMSRCRPRLIASRLERWISKTHKGAVRASHLAFYLDEYTYRFNSRDRGKTFYRIMQNCVIAPSNTITAPKILR